MPNQINNQPTNHRSPVGLLGMGGLVWKLTVSNLMIIPDRNPGKRSVRQQQIEIRAIRRQPTPVVIKRKNLPFRLHGPRLGTRGVLVNVVSQMYHVVDVVFARGVAVGVEEAEGEV